MPHNRHVHRLPPVIPGKRIKTERARPSRRFGLSIIITGLTIGVYWFLFHSTVFQIEKVELTGTESSSVQSVVAHVKGKNIFRTNSAALEQAIRQVYPPAATVTLVRGLPQTVRIAVALRTPALRWQVGDTIFILDSRGEVFEQGDKPEYAQLPKVTDVSRGAIEVGNQIVSPSFVVFIRELQDTVTPLFKRAHLSSEIVETTFHVDVLLEGDVRIRLTTQRPMQEQLDAAYAIFTAHPEAKMIDVRVPKWGYWKE